MVLSQLFAKIWSASLLGAKYLMTHLGSSGEMEEKKCSAKKKKDLKNFEGYKGSTKLLIENSAGAGKQ